MSAPTSKTRINRKRQRTAAPPVDHTVTPLVETIPMKSFEAEEKDKSTDAFSIPGADNIVSCDIPDASSLQSYSSSNKDIQPDELAFASPVINEVNCIDDYTRFAAIGPNSSAKIDVSSVALQTTLTPLVLVADHTTRKILFWELPDEKRHELALLAQFINKQADKKDRINQELNSLFGSTLTAAHAKTTIMNEASDAVILNMKLEATSDIIDDLILKSKVQCLEAVSANDVLQLKSIPNGGCGGNKGFFDNVIANMEQKMNQLSETVYKLEQTANSLELDVRSTPQRFASMLNLQIKSFMSLASRVADAHQAVAFFLEHHRVNS